jgi:hypothetical protein
MSGQYFFDPSKGETPQSVARKRALAEQLAAAVGKPTDIGSGLTALGAGIGSRMARNAADKAERTGMAGADDLMAPIKEKLAQVFGGGTSGAAPSTVEPVTTGSMPSAPPNGDMASYIASAAEKRGINPDVALKVARAEGLADGVWQSNVTKGGMREPSFGEFQLLYGDGKNFPKGMGNDFQQKTGLDPRDPSNRQAMADFALDHAAKNGWGAWYGAKKVGIGEFDGIGQKPQNAAQAANAMATGGKKQAGGEWLRYSNQGAIRNKPISPELQNALGFLPELGVTAEVFSGGQDGERRTGSTRHDHGNAADVFFYKDGRQLNWANPQDRPIFEEIVKRGRANGITGIGAGDGYMRPGSMHIGFGKEAVWGAGGKGSNAPDWLRNAYYSEAGAQPSSSAQVVNAMAQGGQQPMQRDTNTSSGYVRQNMVDGAAEPGKTDGSTRRQGSGLRASIAKLFGVDDGQEQQAQQTAYAPQQPMQPPMQQPAMNAPVQPQGQLSQPRAEVPQGQPPVPGIQPSAPTMGQFAGRMPQPQGQPMAQGMEGLRSAMQPEPQPQMQPQMQQPQGQPQQAPQIPQQVQQVAQVRQQQTGAQIPLAQLLQAAQNPWVAQNPLYSGIISKLVSNQLDQNQPMTPQEVAEYEGALLSNQKTRLELENFGQTPDIAEYKFGQENPDFIEQQIRLKEAGASKTIFDPNGDSSARRKKFDEAVGTDWQKIQLQGRKSASMMQDMDMLDQLIDMAPQGPIQGRLAEMFPGFSSAGAAFNAIVKRVAPTMRAEGSGSTSDIEYDGMLKSLGALQNMPEANRLITGMMKAKAQVDIDLANVVSDWSAGDLTDQGAMKKMQELQSKSIMSPELKRLMIGLNPEEAGGGVDDLVDKWSK